MEEVYPRTPTTNIPEVFTREIGKGRIVYFPGDIDRTFWEILAADHGLVLRNAVRWALNEPDIVTVEGTGVFDITVWKQKESMTVHLVNLTNPMMMQGPFRELIATGPLKVRIRLPKESAVKETRLLVSGQNAAREKSGEEISVVIPSILDHEVVAVDF